MRLVNCTTRDLMIRTAEGRLIELPRYPDRAPRVDVKFGTADRIVIADPHWPGNGAASLRAVVRVRSARWPARDVVHLPAPTERVALIVSVVVAEQAYLQGRSLDDLFVALHTDRPGGVVEVRSLQPAATASPALQALIALRASTPCQYPPRG